MPCRHYKVSGVVQGVFFRASTQQQAQKLGLRGWVKNMPDGSVEAMACGDDVQLITFEKWLQQGPPMARVDRLNITNIENDQEQTDFELQY